MGVPTLALTSLLTLTGTAALAHAPAPNPSAVTQAQQDNAQIRRDTQDI